MARPASAEVRELVFVLGMHRSGTSALTRCLNLLGFKIADDLLAPNKANKGGYWESKAAVRLNERLLGSLDRVWYDPKPVSLDTLTAEQRENFVAGAEKLLCGDLGDAKLAVLKDPRLSRLLPIWREAAERLGYRCSALVACRHPIEVAMSLRTRDGLELPHGLKLWTSYMLDAERQTRTLPRHVVLYDQLLKDWRAALRPAMKAIGLDRKADYRAGWRAITSYLDAGQRNEKATDNAEAGAFAEAERAHSVYDVVRTDLELARSEAYDAARTKWQADWTSESPGDEASDYLLAIGEGYSRMSVQAQDSGKSDEARNWLEKGVKVFPDRAQLHFELGRLQAHDDELDAARQSFERALAIEPDRAGFHHHLSIILGRLDSGDEAIAAAQRALELEPSVPNFHHNLGTLLFHKGDLSGADKAFRRVLAIDPKFAQALHGLSRVHEARGNIERAIKASERAAQLVPSNPTFEKRLAHLKSRLAGVS